MSVDHRRVYREHATAYDTLVSAEDAEGNLLRALESVTELAGATVLEVGAGTGRLTRLLRGVAGTVVGTEISWPMLAVARDRGSLGAAGLCVADARALPVRAGFADVAVAGWVFGHFLEWLPGGWRNDVSAAVGEMRRSLRRGGTIVVLETLGTAVTAAAPPTPELARYYDVLEVEHGFRRQVVRTDYRFADLDSAVELTSFFFGVEMGERVRRTGSAVVPEFTGLWWARA